MIALKLMLLKEALPPKWPFQRYALAYPSQVISPEEALRFEAATNISDLVYQPKLST